MILRVGAIVNAKGISTQLHKAHAAHLAPKGVLIHGYSLNRPLEDLNQRAFTSSWQKLLIYS